MTRPPRGVLGAVVLAATVLVACGRESPSTLDAKSGEASRLADVWWLMFGLAIVVYVVVGSFIVVALLRGRGSDEGRPSRIRDGHFIWIGGIVVPAVILALLAVVTVRSTNALTAERPGALAIDVDGERWWWAVRYPASGVVTANEVHVPVDRAVVVRLRSDNVIHSFWVPQLQGKRDLVPGQVTELRFTADQPGVYRGECAEYCGLQHANMNFLVVAHEPADFERWLARRIAPLPDPSSELAARGRAVFERQACAGCHTIRGTEAQGTLGPALSDFGSRRTIGANTVPNDSERLTRWIADSQSIKRGNLMPPFFLSSDDLRSLVAYLESLR